MEASPLVRYGVHVQLEETSRLVEIAERDRRFDLFNRTSPETVDRGLRGLAPLLLSSDGTRLLWGFILLRAIATETPVPERLPAVTLESASPVDELVSALICEGRPGAYGWMERLRISTFIEGDDATIVAPYIQPQGDPLAAIVRFRELPERERLLVDAETIDLRTAEIIAVIDDGALTTALEETTHLSFSRRRTVMTSLAEYFSGEQVAPARQREILEAAQRSGDVEAFVRRLRYPTLAAMEERVDAFSREFVKGRGVHFSLPPHFEGDRITVSFTFRDGGEYRKRLEALRRAEEGVDELLGLLF